LGWRSYSCAKYKLLKEFFILSQALRQLVAKSCGSGVADGG